MHTDAILFIYIGIDFIVIDKPNASECQITILTLYGVADTESGPLNSFLHTGSGYSANLLVEGFWVAVQLLWKWRVAPL